MRVLFEVLLRAPLLPVAALHDPARALRAAALGPAAIRLASPTLVEHGDSSADVAWRRYGKRAAFRATPNGLLAGVMMARTIDGASAISLGEPDAHLGVCFARVASLGSALLYTEAGWRDCKLRVTPSLLRHGDHVSWFSMGEDSVARVLHAEVDAMLDLVLRAASEWASAPRLCKALGALVGDLDDARSVLLDLVASNLLHHDLEPPLVGQPPLEWAKLRFEALAPSSAFSAWCGRVGAAEALGRIEADWQALPGSSDGEVILPTLCHRSEVQPRIASAPLARAAEGAPLLFALADALHPPLREVELAGGVTQACEAASALVGEGLLPVTALHFGHYGVRADSPLADEARVPHAPVVAWLSGAAIACARAGLDELELDEDRLRSLLPAHNAPATFELHVQPCTPPAAGREGDDWLLGLHGPAGSSWGRFHAALGEPMSAALSSLRDAENALDRDAVRLDVAYAPSRALADLCQVPALRDAALAITSWPEGNGVRPADCAVANEPAGPAHLGVAAPGHAVVISPLHRVRSTTAPPSVYRALLGDTLVRQHAPWAFGWGPLRLAPWLPRVRHRGFVVAPQSWAVPHGLDDVALRRWRSEQRVPRWVQIGAEDVLLALDLDDAGDREALVKLSATDRVYEIWPPLGRELDESGRRVELIAAVVNDTPVWHARNERLASMAVARPPVDGAAAPGWRTLKLYAPAANHEALLVEVLAPFVATQKGIEAWFFLPYADASGDHLRVRVQGRDAAIDSIVNRFVKVLNQVIEAGGLVAVEVGSYRPEHARYREALPAVEKIFASDSRLVVDLLEVPLAVAPECTLVASFDALARGLGFALADRIRISNQALSAYQLDDAQVREELAPGYRALQQPLLSLLEKLPPAYRAHEKRVKSARLSRAARDALLPTLLHLSSVRLCGAERDRELRALYLWTRALASQAAKNKKRR